MVFCVCLFEFLVGLEISDRQDVTVEEFGELWISFSMFNAANNGTTLTLDSLEQFERKLAADRRAKKAGKSVVVEKEYPFFVCCKLGFFDIFFNFYTVPPMTF